MNAATIDMFDEVDRQLVQLARAGTTPSEQVPIAHAGPLPLVRAPRTVPVPEVTWLPPPPTQPHASRTRLAIAAMVVAVLGLGTIATVNVMHLIDGRGTLTGKAAVDSVVSRIIAAESRGAVDPKNKRSSAAGPAQFLDDTWLELIRAYRPDLTKELARDDILALRQKPGLAREMAQRFAERNAAVLRRRGLPVTAATLYLAHFAGPAGAAALLKAPDDADAAAVMAKADPSGNTTRERIVKANPFLDTFTVADIKGWAERKMDGPRLVLTELVSRIRSSP
jgi:hypothetical protein